MFCNRCGAQLAPGATMCAACGVAQSAAAPVVPAGNRVQQHVNTLAVLWLVLAAITLIPVIILVIAGTVVGATVAHSANVPPAARIFGPVFALFYGIACVVALFTAATFAAGWGLLKLRTWGRTVAIVMGVLVLLHPPLGTALGIYTLWVLLATGADQQYRAMAQP